MRALKCARSKGRSIALRNDPFAQRGWLLAKTKSEEVRFVKTGARKLFASELLALVIAPRPARDGRGSAMISRAIVWLAKWRTVRHAARLQRVDRIIERGISAVE
jgi:hypothetical protein